MLTWEYRVLKRTYPNGEVEFGVYEVYWGGSEKREGTSKDPVIIVGDTLEQINIEVRNIVAALSKPVLEYKE